MKRLICSFALRIQWIDPFPMKLMAKASVTLRDARLRCAVPFCQVRPVIREKGITVLLPKTSVKWKQKLFGRRGADGRKKKDGFG